MSMLETYQPLLSEKSHLTSQEVMGVTGCKRPKTSKDLSRLVKLGKLIKIHRGKWVVCQNANRLQLPELLSGDPTYCTAHTALAWHGMIEQIPNAIYAVTSGRPMKKTTPMGPVHIHRITPDLFQGWENQSTRSGVANPAKVATPEKAIVDFFYLSIMGHPPISKASPKSPCPPNSVGTPPMSLPTGSPTKRGG